MVKIWLKWLLYVTITIIMYALLVLSFFVTVTIMIMKYVQYIHIYVDVHDIHR